MPILPIPSNLHPSEVLKGAHLSPHRRKTGKSKKSSCSFCFSWGCWFWLSLVVAGCYWLLLVVVVVVAGCCWLLLVVVGCCWLLLVVVGCCWLLMLLMLLMLLPSTTSKKARNTCSRTPENPVHDRNASPPAGCIKNPWNDWNVAWLPSWTVWRKHSAVTISQTVFCCCLWVSYLQLPAIADNNLVQNKLVEDSTWGNKHRTSWRQHSPTQFSGESWGGPGSSAQNTHLSQWLSHAKDLCGWACLSHIP